GRNSGSTWMASTAVTVADGAPLGHEAGAAAPGLSMLGVGPGSSLSQSGASSQSGGPSMTPAQKQSGSTVCSDRRNVSMLSPTASSVNTIDTAWIYHESTTHRAHE